MGNAPVLFLAFLVMPQTTEHSPMLLVSAKINTTMMEAINCANHASTTV